MSEKFVCLYLKVNIVQTSQILSQMHTLLIFMLYYLTLPTLFIKAFWKNALLRALIFSTIHSSSNYFICYLNPSSVQNFFGLRKWLQFTTHTLTRRNWMHVIGYIPIKTDPASAFSASHLALAHITGSTSIQLQLRRPYSSSFVMKIKEFVVRRWYKKFVFPYFSKECELLRRTFVRFTEPLHNTLDV